MNLALFQPDIPQNVGAALRLCACLSVPCHIIEPTTFPWKEREFRRSGMDYIDHVTLIKHTGWTSFKANTQGQRLILIETDGASPLWDFTFLETDILVMGSESAGVTPQVMTDCHASLHIPMAAGLRSMNVVTAAAFTLAEALRQTRHKK